MKYKFFYVLFLLCFNGLFAQGYQVTDFQKIDETNGDFNVILDDEDWFGHAVEGIGDLNGDGINDIAVSALQDDDGAFNIGAVYIMFLTAENTVDHYQKISALDGGFTGNLEEWDYFGRSLSFLGDLNNDGYIELAVGAEYDGDGGYRHGAVWILSLEQDGTLFSHQKISDIEGNFEGILDVWDVFGSDVANIGDLNGDGNTDIAVGARRDGDGGEERGAVWILFLNADFTVSSFQKISDTHGGFEADLEFKDYFWGAVSAIGDLNQDGIVDLAIGAYRDNDGGDNKGSVYILFMNANGTVNHFQKISTTSGGGPDDLELDALFGVSVDLAADIDADGKINLLVGCGNYGGELRVGYFYILNLNSDGTVEQYMKYSEGIQGFDGVQIPGDYFGHSVSMLNGDPETMSILVGAFGDGEDVGIRTGSAWIIELGGVLSIEEVSTSSLISIAPNPTKNTFSFNSVNGVSSVQLYDVQGRLLKDFKQILENTFNVSYMPVGHYIILVTDDQGTISSFKLIKE